MIQENRGSGSELKRKWELAAGLIGVGGEGEGRLAVNRCDVKWPLIYPWNARGAIAGSATLGNYFTARYGGLLRLAYVPRSHTRNVVPANLNLEIRRGARAHGPGLLEHEERARNEDRRRRYAAT